MPNSLVFRMIAIPLVSAFTGYLTNYIAVRMLFRPRRSFRIFGFEMQGLIPRRRREIAEKIGETVERHLISHEDVRRALEAPEVADRIRGMLDDRVSTVLETRLAGFHPMAAMFLTGSMKGKIKQAILEEVMGAVGPMTDEMLGILEENLDFREVVVRKIEDFDLDMFERIVLEISSRELREIEVLGGVLGLVIGLVTDLLFLF
jgi:uncharacterized membrane protein YheB (UPF0754 family)